MTDSTTTLLHICTAANWRAARSGTAVPTESLDAVGFVHLSTPAQVHLPANRLFAGRTDLVLLVLDHERLDAPVEWEPGVPGDPESMLFPHLYGPLPIAAVKSVVDYPPDSDGTFSPPDL